jgi:hypothetical protein
MIEARDPKPVQIFKSRGEVEVSLNRVKWNKEILFVSSPARR